MQKDQEFEIDSETRTEQKFDTRLLDKKIDDGFLSREERERYLSALPEETEVDFTSMEEVMNLQDSEQPSN